MGLTVKTPEKLAEILARLGAGEPLANICRDPKMPHSGTVSDWCKTDKAFGEDFARARKVGFDAIAADCLQIADDGTNDYMIKKAAEEGAEPGRQFDAEHVQRSKLRVETRLKLLAVWDYERYGKKLDMKVDADVRGSVAYVANMPQRNAQN